MDTSASQIPAPSATRATSAHGAVTPWYCWVTVFGATSIAIGVIWDISWHLSIGRDTFWTPAHLAIYLGGVAGGCACGWQVILNTFFPKHAPQAGRTIRVLGFRGSLGSWITIWGAGAMLVSAPFDNWWHNAYGLDVKILSPPHSVLALGIYGIAVGAMLTVLSEQNQEGASRASRWLLLYMGGIMLTMAAIWVTEFSYPNDQHNLAFFLVSCWVYPHLLGTVAMASGRRWAVTSIALFYMLIRCAMVWILPHFHAQPMLAPIRNPIDYMVPPTFPILLIVPAIFMDLVRHRFTLKQCWKKDLAYIFCMTAAFVIPFVITQWNFADFIVSGGGDNAFFKAHQVWGYTDYVGPHKHMFWSRDGLPLSQDSWKDFLHIAPKLGYAFLLALGSSTFGFLIGGLLQKVRR